MEYALEIDGNSHVVPGGTGLMLVHPSIGETDRIDTEFLRSDTDAFLVVSTRTTAREVKQKLEYYEVDESKAVILDTLSIERGYSRRRRENVHYVASPDDVDGIISQVTRFLETHEGKRRISFDSVTELAYYAGEDRARDAVEELSVLLDTHDAIGLFHVSDEVHDEETIEAYRRHFDGVIELDQDGTLEMTL